MSDDVFRFVVAAGVVLAALAFIIQAGVVIALYRGSKKTQQKVIEFVGEVRPVVAKVGPLLDKAGPVIAKAGPAIERIGPVADKVGVLVDKGSIVLASANRIIEETRPRIAEISAEAVDIARSGREQVERLGSLLHDAGERARTRLEQIDQTVENTVEQVEHVGDSLKRAVVRPVKGVNGFAAGISAAVSTLVHGSRKSSVDSATQDEEMFI